MDKVPLFWRGVVCEPSLGTVVVADSLAHLRFRFRWWPIKTLWLFGGPIKPYGLFFGSAKGYDLGPVFYGLGDACYTFFVRVISFCLNAEGAPRRLMAKEFAPPQKTPLRPDLRQGKLHRSCQRRLPPQPVHEP